MRAGIKRRRLLIAGAAGGLALLAGDAHTVRAVTWRWHGSALGAESTIVLAHRDQAAVQSAVAACLTEIERLERIFSLYRADSALSQLNRIGRLDAPPLELVELLAFSARVSAATGGAFDVTVQPLWNLYADHFAEPAADPAGPGDAALATAMARVGWRGIEITTGRIAFRRTGMAVTLNGVAQGYITDRIADLLRERGFTDLLVELGEIRALGRRPDGDPWQTGIADPLLPRAISRRVALMDAALASSAGSGTWLDPGHRHHHLLDPTTGRSAKHHAGVSVQAGRAVVADALSTAISILPAAAARSALAALGPATAYLVAPDGRQTIIVV
jgi:thiamine biosynthesis lipoprotein